MAVSGQRHTSEALLSQGRTTVLHWIRRWVGLRAGLDIQETSFAFAGDRIPVVQSVVSHYDI
jgi:hypothetical protein